MLILKRPPQAFIDVWHELCRAFNHPEDGRSQAQRNIVYEILVEDCYTLDEMLEAGRRLAARAARPQRHWPGPPVFWIRAIEHIRRDRAATQLEAVDAGRPQ